MNRALSTEALNRTVLARQMLLERSRLPLHRVVERMAGVQAQYAPSPYIGLWSRVGDFQRSDLTSALKRRSVIQATLMRGTIHLVSRADFWPLAQATRPGRQEGWIRTLGKSHDIDRVRSLAGELEVLLTDGPRKRRDLIAELGIDSETWNGVVQWVDLIRVPPSGTWESRRADLHGLATTWIAHDDADPEVGRDLLIRRYLAGFGPATRSDIQSFTLLSREVIDASLDRLRIRTLMTEEGIELVDVSRATLVDGDTPAPVRFLGNWDASLLVHARRADILPEGQRPRIFSTRAPHSFATFLVDGRVRGTWKEEGGKVVLDVFDPIPRRFTRGLEAERARLERFLSD